MEDWIEAYLDCRRRKRNTASAIAYEVDYLSRLVDLCERVNDRSYRPSRSIAFVVRKPRYREVFAADFSDRVVHHYISLRLEPLFEEVFNERTFNCRKGKGTQYGVRRLYDDIRECSQGYARDCYVAKFDLRGFFMSIDKRLMVSLVDDFIVERYDGSDKEDLRYLCRITIEHNPEEDCIRRSPASYWEMLPPNKSLFTNGTGKGMPIGNLPSQLFANFLLNGLDWFVERSGFRYHGRYVDDFYLVHEEKERILSFAPRIREYLSFLHLELHPHKFYLQHYSKGASFIGSTVKFGRLYVNRVSLSNLRRAVLRLNRKCNASNVHSLVASVNCYLGLMRTGKCYACRRSSLGLLDSRAFRFVYVCGHHEKLSVRREYKQSIRIKDAVRKGKVFIPSLANGVAG